MVSKLTSLNEYALMFSSSRRVHTKDQILQTCCLRCRPMNAIDTYISCNGSGVQYEIPDLAIKSIGCIETQGSGRSILIAIDERKSREV